MYRGPTLAIQGSLFGSGFLVMILLLITGSSSFKAQAIDNQSIPANIPSNSDQYQTDSSIITNCNLNLSYPDEVLQWCEFITKYSLQQGLDPNLVAALVLQESGGNYLAMSHSGAVGLMQVMPRDGIAASFSCANGPCFANRPTISELRDPEFNISYGTNMLSNLLSRYGSMREALRAYGPMDMGYFYADKVLGIYENHKF